jgi:hypothetical protein
MLKQDSGIVVIPDLRSWMGIAYVVVCVSERRLREWVFLKAKSTRRTAEKSIGNRSGECRDEFDV